ncbi:MAG: hypothetical protein PHE17_20720 [Thiothrix sp.]|uniref:hypothetical protein n=1 Tax=Thiothrix sp. TaxID=1032 RepID=UPI0026379F90|nr:hypothetical protein [Thiothrix sp.]MDD5395455.1 hypothetical protein [Thiothrix sp.]
MNAIDTNNLLSAITPAQVLLVVALLTALSVAAAVLNYRNTKDAPHAGVFFAHVQVWQMSTLMNMLFWYMLGASTDAISAAVLPALFFCADLAKVIVPRQASYAHSWGKQAAVNFLRVLSIAATIGLGSLFAQQNANNTLDAELAHQQIQASTKAADARVQSNAPDAESLALQEQLRTKITAIQNRPALTASGKYVYLNGKNTAPSSVWAVTQGCKQANPYTKVPKNGCEELIQTRINLDKLASGLSSQAKNLDRQSETLQTAREQLKSAKPALPVNDMIAGVLRFFGASTATTSDPKSISLVFGTILAVAFELLIVITLIPHAGSQNQPQPAAPGKMAKLKFLVRTLRKISKIAGKVGVKRGSDAGQNLDKTWIVYPDAQSEGNGAMDGLFGEPAKPSELGDFKKVTLLSMTKFIDLNVIGGSDGVKLKDGHKQALVLLMQHYGKPVATCQFYETVRQQHGEGIRKAYIDDAKLILHRNGYMNAVPYGSRGVKYEWVDERTLRTVIRQKRSGVDRQAVGGLDGGKVVALRPATPPATKPASATRERKQDRNHSLELALQPA